MFQDIINVTDTIAGNISTTYFGGIDLHICVSSLPDGYAVEDVSSCDGRIDVEGIGDNALSLVGDQTVDGVVTFEDSLEVQGNISVKLKLNDLYIPGQIYFVFVSF